MNVHDLKGCAPTPLAHYLKALGILRLVAEQADPKARGWWEGERFRLSTELDSEAMENFFLKRYEPTALVSPWNKGSGFFYSNDPGLSAIETSTAQRFGRIRDGIKAGRSLLEELSTADQVVRAIKNETKAGHLTKTQKQALKESPKYKKRVNEAEKRFKAIKIDLVPEIRRVWRGPHREWMDAAMVLGDDGPPRFPALLGTGGNDGRLDFTNNFMQRLSDVFDLTDPTGFPRYHASDWISASLWGTPIKGIQIGSAVGQFLPGLAGGANSTNGPSGESLLNPMDFLLLMEGCILFTVHAARRMGTLAPLRAAAPFAVGAQGAGYASSSDTDESARGEQWMPLWSQPMTLIELHHLFAEGRAQIGAKVVREPLDMARAVSRLGTARGIIAFQRYGYIERNGQSNLAVPLGRFRVPDKIYPRLSCLDDLDVWLGRLRRDARNKQAPTRLQLVERRLADALFALTQHPDEASRWQSVLLKLADIEGVLLTGKNYRAGPLPPLRPEWVAAADDGSVAYRLAVACALQADEFRLNKSPIDPVRCHWFPKKNDETSVVMKGRSGLDDAISLVERRLIEAGQRGERRLPLAAAYRAGAASADLATLLFGTVDLDHVMALARALMAIDGVAWALSPRPPRSADPGETPDDAWLAIRLAMLPWPLPDGRKIGVDPAILRRLGSGDGQTAVELALRRLGAAGIHATLRVAAVPHDTSRLWAAALAFPITKNTAERFLNRLERTEKKGDLS